MFSSNLVFASSLTSANEPIHIAAIFSMSGIAARHNMPLVDMMNATIEHINEKGGVLGRQIDLVVYDNESTPLGSLEATKLAIAAGATAVLGAHWSSHSLVMASLLQEAKIPMITPGSTNPQITMGKNYVFRVCFLDSMQGFAMAKFIREEHDIKQVAVLRNIDEQYSVDLAGFFADAFKEMGGEVVYDTGYRGNAMDYTAIIKDLLLFNPEAIYIPGYTRDTALFMKQARTLGITATFLGGDAWDIIGSLIADPIEGSYRTVGWHPEVPYQETQDMLKMLRDHSNSELRNMSVPLAYDAVRLLVDAIGRAGSAEPWEVREALAATKNFPGATGPISFTRDGDPENKEVIIVQYIQGQTEYVTAVKP